MEFNFEHQPGMFVYDRKLVTSGVPKVSIITPFYNGAKTIEQTFNCVVNQTFPWFEWIIVNDGSTKKEDVKFLEKLAERDPRVRVVHKENGGISTARNYGVRCAKTEYLLPLDCDDLIEPTFVEYCWWMLEKNPKAAWAYTDSVGFGDEEYLWNQTFNPELLKKENHLTATALIRRDWYEKVGGYAEIEKHYNEDWFFWLQILAQGGYPVQAQGGEYQFWYRRTNTGVLSIVKGNEEQAKKNRKMIENAAKDVIDPHEPVIYPKVKFNYTAPKFTEWNKSIYKEHKKIHLTIMAPWLEMGGADKFNLDLITGLDKNKYEISILTTVPSSEPWCQSFRDQIPDVFNLPNFVEYRDFAEFVSYFLISRETDILMVTNSYHGYYMLPWIRQHFPKILIIDYVHMEEWYWRNGGYSRCTGAMDEIIEKTFVCNNATCRVMQEKFAIGEKKIDTIHIGVDTELFDEKRVRAGITYKRLDIEENRPIVLFICRLHPQKRPYLMLEIAKRVRKEIPNVAFVVVGDGQQEGDLKNAVVNQNLEGTVYFSGATKEPRPYYKDAKVTLICSIKEGLALTAYESLSMGVPVVSADVGGQSDLIDEEVGALIECEQEEATDIHKKNFTEHEIGEYAKALVQILSDPELQKEMSERGRKRIVERFSIACMVSRFSNEFENLVKDKELASRRVKISAMLQEFPRLVGDIFTMEMQEQVIEQGFNPYIFTEANPWHVNESVEMASILSRLNCQDTILARHEEVVNRHEEVVNDDWAWLKNLEKRVSAIERKRLGYKIRKLMGLK